MVNAVKSLAAWTPSRNRRLRSPSPELKTQSSENWSPPRKRRVRNTPSPECPEVVTPESKFLQSISKDPIRLEKAEKLYVESVKRERPFWPKGLFHSSSDNDSDDCDKFVQTERPIHVTAASRSEDQRNQFVEYETDEKPFNCTICHKSFRYVNRVRALQPNPTNIIPIDLDTCCC